jgi:hypothetical protein
LDTENKELGPLFRVPITVIIPEEITGPGYLFKRTLNLKPVETVRLFLKNPTGALYASKIAL